MRAQELPISTIVLIILALVILVLAIVFIVIPISKPSIPPANNNSTTLQEFTFNCQVSPSCPQSPSTNVIPSSTGYCSATTSGGLHCYSPQIGATCQYQDPNGTSWVITPQNAKTLCS